MLMVIAPIALREEYEEYSMDVIKSCEDCPYYKGCEDCGLSGTGECDKEGVEDELR